MTIGRTLPAWLCGVTLFLVPLTSAAQTPPCSFEPFDERPLGAVASVELFEAPTSLPPGRSVQFVRKSRTEFSPTGLSAVQTIFSRDSPLQSYPTRTWKFDSSGRVLTESYRLDGGGYEWTCHYDDQGQVARAVMTSGAEGERIITFTRGDGWRSQRFRTSVASILTTQWLDGSGRVIRSVEHDELQRYDRLATKIQYSPDGREECSGEGVPSRCTRVRVDSHGNVVERAPPDGNPRSTHRWDYDAVGNWVLRVSATFLKEPAQGATPPRINRFETTWRRDITYW